MEQGELMSINLSNSQHSDMGLHEGHMMAECPSDRDSRSQSAATTPSPLTHHIASSSTSQPLSSPADTGSPSSSNGALTIAYPSSPPPNGINMALVPYSGPPSVGGGPGGHHPPPSHGGPPPHSVHGGIPLVSSQDGGMNVVSTTADSPFRPYHQELKYMVDEACPVCGDKVSGYHYGLLTCESCKGFFKRTVQNKKVYSCVDNRSCAIDKSQRKRCPYCRFQKCLRVGMKLEAVRQDRMRGGRNKFGPMYKRDRALKQQAARQTHHLLGIGPADIRPDMAMLSPSGSFPGPIPFSHHGAMPSSYIPQGSLMASMPPLTPAVAHGGMIRHVPPLIEQLKSHEPNEKDLQEKVFAFAQYHFASSDVKPKQELILGLCKLADHCLFLLVEWARGSLFFRELKVEDQMKLLQNCWSELLIIEYSYRQMRSLRTYLPSFDSVAQLETLPQLSHLEFLPRLGLPDIRLRLFELIKLFSELNMDQNEYVCLKSLLLLNPDILGLDQRQFIEESQEKINAALLEYCVRFHPEVKDKFGQLLLRLSEIRIISIRAEEFLYNKHVNGDVLGQTLLLEMLHSKRK